MAEEIKQDDIDSLADVIWWIKGYHAAFEDSAMTCPFQQVHIDSLTKIKKLLQEKLKKKES